MSSSRAEFTVPPTSSSNLGELLWQAAHLHGDQPAVVERDRTMHFAPLRFRAAAVATALITRGLGRNDRVAILLERGADAIAALCGVYAAGGVAVVVNDRLRPRQIEYVLRHCAARVLVTGRDLLDRLPRDLATDTEILELATIPHGGVFEPVDRLASDPAQIIYTSGSTGLPKGVVFSHGALSAGVETVAGYLGLTGDDRIASLLPLSSVYGMNQVLCALRRAATVVVERSPVPHQVVSTIRDHKISVLAAVPPLWLQLLTVPSFIEEVISSLRILQNAGGHLPTEAARRLRQAQPRADLFLQYGMTETFRSTYLPPNEVDRHPNSIGRAIPGAEVLVLRDDLSPCETGEVGELVHRGPTIASGYWNDPDATGRVFRPHPTRPPGAPSSELVVFSGDMVRRDAEGFMYFVGRQDRMIKTMGFRVGPDEVADVLHASGEVHETLIDTEPDPERGDRIIAYVVLRPGGSLERLTRHCRMELPTYMQPGRIELRTELPRLASGKYDRDRVRGRTPPP